MAVTSTAAAQLRCLRPNLSNLRPRYRFSGDYAPRFLAMAQQKKANSDEYAIISILKNWVWRNKKQKMKGKKKIVYSPNDFFNNNEKVNKYDSSWEKKWFGAGIFYEGTEEVEFDVYKKLEKSKVLSNVEKAGLLSKAEEFGITLSSIEKLGLFSKAEDLGLLSLLEKAAGSSPSALASAALPILVAAIVAIVVIPDDSVGLVAVQAVVAGALGVAGAGLFIGSVVLEGLQEAE